MIELNKLTDLEVLTLTIIGESRGEPIEGQVAVGCVIRNRVNSRKKNYLEICLANKQFSCWNEDDPNRPVLIELAQILIGGDLLEGPVFSQCTYVAIGILENKIMDNTYGSVNYLTKDLFYSPNRPSWAKNINFITAKGKQVFFSA